MLPNLIWVPNTLFRGLPIWERNSLFSYQLRVDFCTFGVPYARRASDGQWNVICALRNSSCGEADKMAAQPPAACAEVSVWCLVLVAVLPGPFLSHEIICVYK